MDVERWIFVFTFVYLYSSNKTRPCNNSTYYSKHLTHYTNNNNNYIKSK